METKKYKYVNEFCMDIIDKHDDILNKDEFGSVGIVTYYNEAKEIIKHLICYGFGLKYAELEDYEIDNYGNEFLITLDFEKEIWCEKIKRENDYFDISTPIVFLHSDVNSKIINHLFDAEEVIEFDLIDDTDELEDGDCSEICECCGCMEDDEMKDIGTISCTITNGEGYHCYSITSSDEDELKRFKKFVLEL